MTMILNTPPSPGLPRQRLARKAASLLMVGTALGCAGAPDSTGVDATKLGAPASPFVVSAPHALIALKSSSMPGDAAAPAETDVVYVALSPGSIPNASLITIRVRSTGAVVTAPAVDGGLDPVPVPATANDTLEIGASITGGTAVLYVMPVPPKGRPVVIRTSPPPKRRDVPLNMTVVIVFSEPIAASSLTPSAVQLANGATVVRGRLGFADAQHLTAALTPESPLSPETNYTLTITQAVQNLDGQPLAAPVTIEFTTEPATATVPTLRGHVMDDEGNPLVGATITIGGFPETTPPVAVTDGDGNYSFPYTLVSGDGWGEAAGYIWTQKPGYEGDVRWVWSLTQSYRLYRLVRFAAGESISLSIDPANNRHSCVDWVSPFAWACRTVHIVVPAGRLTVQVVPITLGVRTGLYVFGTNRNGGATCCGATESLNLAAGEATAYILVGADWPGSIDVVVKTSMTTP